MAAQVRAVVSPATIQQFMVRGPVLTSPYAALQYHLRPGRVGGALGGIRELGKPGIDPAGAMPTTPSFPTVGYNFRLVTKWLRILCASS
jgi:hypothetical protein